MDESAIFGTHIARVRVVAGNCERSDLHLQRQELTVTQTPLPAAFPLLATGLGALGLLGWRRKRKVQAV